LSDPAPPTITAGLGTNPTTCLSIDGKIAFTTSLPDGMYRLDYTGVGSPKNVTVSGGAFELTGLPDGTFSGFSITTGGCTGVANTIKTLTDPANPTITAGTPTNPTTCSGTNGRISFTTSLPDGMYSLSYTGAGSPQNITVASGKFTLGNLRQGTYSGFSVTTGGCLGIDNTTKPLSDPTPPTLTLGTASNPTTCGGSDGSINFTSTNLPDGTYSLRFTSSGTGATTSPQNVNVLSNAFTLSLKKGTYRNFSITNTATNCIGSTTAPKTLTEPLPPTISCVGNLLDNSAVGVCGKNISYNSTVTGSPTITYAFTGATTASGSGNGSGSFFNVGETTVTLTATNSCGTVNCSFTVKIDGTPTLTLGTIPVIGAGVTSFTIPYIGSTRTPTTYSISGTGITPVTDAHLTNPIRVNLSLAASGASIPFTLTVKNASGCTSPNIMSSVAVNPPLSIATPTFGFILCQGDETTIMTTASGGSGVFQYSLNGGAYQTNNIFTVRGGAYTITAKDGIGSTINTALTTVQDGFPALQCPQPMTVDASQMGANGSVPTSISGNVTIFSQCLTPSTSAVTEQVFDVNCGVVSPQNNNFTPASLVDIQKVIIRQFSAGSGIITYSCYQSIFVRQPKLEDVAFPSNRTLTCANLRTEPTDGVVNNALVVGTGSPSSAGSTLNETAFKGFTATYTDIRTTTATGFTIQRTWTVSKCGGGTGNTRTFVQTITVPTCGTAPSIAGSIGREDGTAVPAKTVLYNSLTGRTDSTTGTTYSFANLLNNSNVRVKPTRPNTDWTSGVTMLDVSLLSKHLLDINPINSPYNIISADVNLDGEVDATDMLLMQRLILRLIPALPNNNSWRFVLKNHVFRNPTNPFANDFPEILVVPSLTSSLTNGDFVAIKVGDINQSAGSVNIRGGVKAFMLNTEDRVLEKGKTYQIPIQLTPSVSSLQFTLNVDKSAAKIERIEKGNLPNFTDNNTGLFQKEGLITAAWYRKDGQSLSETDNFTMMTVSLTPTVTTRLSEIMTINSAYTEGVAYDAKGNGSPVQLAFGNKIASSEKAILLPNRPNPFSNETTLAFTLPEASVAKLTVCDLLGKVIMSSERAFEKGLNEVVFDATTTPSISSSVFVVRLQTATGVVEQKIVLQR
jgi:hypothetical protein